jgi:hypothetical protein
MINRSKRIAIAGAALLLGAAIVAVVIKFAGVLAIIVVCVAGIAGVIAVAVRRAGQRRTETIFNFYVQANEILGRDGSARYRFEITEAIKSGEKVVRMLPDPPPLSSFALGALYHSIGDHNGAIGHLALGAEEEMLKESPHVSPSRRLRRYVKRLRQIERRPDRWPKLSAAIASLERMHRERSAQLLAENQVQLKRLVEAFDNQLTDQSAQQTRVPVQNFAGRSFKSITPPPPISEVLSDVYQEEPSS